MLILIRHSISQPQPGLSAHQWALTDEGRLKCVKLAERLHPYALRQIYSSDEPKAVNTAELLRQNLDLPLVQIDTELCETRRATAPYYDSPQAFQAAIHAAMLQSDQLLYGEETFQNARERFSTALHRIIDQHPDQTVGVVSHGTVLSLFLAPLMKRDVFDLWQAWTMPAFVVLSTPDLNVRELALHFGNAP